MQLEHKFSVPAPLDVVWQAVTDPKRVAPCMPGATLKEANGAEFTGTVKVKLGPVSLLYKGTGEFLERDEAARRVVIKAFGKDSGGNGTAAATVTVTLSGSGASTDGVVFTDLNVTGRPAQFGRGMISDVAGKMLDRFAECLASRLGENREQVEVEPEPDKHADPDLHATHRPVAEDAEPLLGGEPINLASFASGAMFKRAASGTAIVAALIVVFLLGRRTSC